MCIIKLVAVSSFLRARKYWNSRTSDYRTCKPVPNKDSLHRLITKLQGQYLM